MKDLEPYKIELVSFEEKAQEIIELRDLSWRENPTGNAVKYSVKADSVFDVKSTHMVIYAKDEIVAAARIFITNELKEVSHYSHFGSNSNTRLKGPFGSITRVVVHPDHRLNGLAVKIMLELEKEARKVGVFTLLGYPANWSMKLMKICHYEMVENLGAIIKELPGIDHFLMKKELA